MEIISKVNLRVDDMELAHTVFASGLGLVGNPHKTITRYKMSNHSEILVYQDSEIFRESPTHVYLTVTAEKVTKVHEILKKAGVKYLVFHENVGDGIINTLEWGMADGSSLRLESFEDNYWTK
jgi:predicted urease superfamily metal-dependent hydrolase